MEYEWDEKKNLIHVKKHEIDFLNAVNLFKKDYVIYLSDNEQEERYLATGEVDGKRITVIYIVRGNTYRIISARRAKKHE